MHVMNTKVKDSQIFVVNHCFQLVEIKTLRPLTNAARANKLKEIQFNIIAVCIPVTYRECAAQGKHNKAFPT